MLGYHELTMTVQKSLSGRLPCDTPALPVSLNRKHRKGAVLWLSPALYFLQNKEMLSCTPAGKGVKGNGPLHTMIWVKGHTHTLKNNTDAHIIPYTQQRLDFTYTMHISNHIIHTYISPLD